MVSERAKEIIESHDIGHSRFVPLRVFERPNMQSLDRLWYHWVLTRSYRLKRETFSQAKRLRTNSSFDMDIAWELSNNIAFRQHISTIPFWTRLGVKGKIALCKEIFIDLKNAGLTGLNEIRSESVIGREPHETVGHLL